MTAILAVRGALPSAPPPTGYDNLSNWPSAANRPTYTAGTNTLSWIGPIAGGASTANDVQQSQVLTNSSAVTSSSNGQLIENLNINSGASSSGIVIINHNNVTVRRCRIRNASGAGFGPVVSWSGTGGLIEDCLVDGASSGGLTNSQNGVDPFSASGLVMRRLNVQNCENHIRSAVSATVIDCWLHAAVGSDADMIELDCNNGSAAINGWTIQHNTGDGGDTTGSFLDSFTNPDNFNHSAGGAAVQNVSINNNAMINFASAPSNFNCIIADAGQAGWNGTVNVGITNNGFFNRNGYASIQGGATASPNSGNFIMATATATSGSLANGTGVV